MIKIGLVKFGFCRITLAVGVPLGIASSAFAQEAVRAPATEASTERVFVTGSAIPTAAEVGPNPVLNVTRDLINKSGERNTEELLRNLPVANANGVPVSNNENGSNTAVGAATIALRGFDARATLILLDGRRVAVYPTGNNRMRVALASKRLQHRCRCRDNCATRFRCESDSHPVGWASGSCLSHGQQQDESRSRIETAPTPL